MYLQDSLHFCQGLSRVCGFNAYSLGAVHAGAAAEPDDGVASFFQIQGRGCFHICSRRIYYGPVVDGIRDIMLCERFFQTLCKPQF